MNFSLDELARYQLHHLKALVRFAADHVEAYADRLKVASVLNAPDLATALAVMPILGRSDLASNGLGFRADELPAGQALSGQRRSSGTSGEVVAVETTSTSFGWQNALTFRSFLWTGWDLGKTIGGIRSDRNTPAPYPEGIKTSVWDAPTIFPFPTGPAVHLGTSASLEQQWERLASKRPSYLMTYPSIVRAFAARAGKEGRGPCDLAGILTVGETVDADLRDAAREHLGADIHDVYSAEEIGMIACQCPTCRRYHSQDESIIVEILDPEGRPCRAGQSGRVVLTPLHNFATPLLRYDIGDIAEVGAPCACGRGLQTINRIIGRQRNIFKLADGRSFWPSFGVKKFSSFVHVRQHQFRQLGYDRLEVVLATADPVTPDVEDRIRQTILKRLPIEMQINFRYVAEIPREPGGKYQEFVCLVA